MKYNFDEIINRRGTGSLKWDVSENELPMWVADMDFKTSPAIIEAIKSRTEHGIFGYGIVPDEWYEAYIDWWSLRHGFKMSKQWLIFCTGVVPAISSCVRKLTTPAEKVLIQTPVYNIFFNSILNNGRVPLEVPLKYCSGEYEIDFSELEDKLSDPQTSMMILCNPHNPVGKIWDKETLARIGELCLKHHVTVLSDEIHCDLTAPGKEYVPFASVSDACRRISVSMIAPTKTFNIAGLQTACVCVPEPDLRHKVERALNTDEVAEPNCFAVAAAIAAFTKGSEWLDALRDYIQKNKDFAEQFVSENIPPARIVRSEATYLLWLDCSGICDDSNKLADYIRNETGLYLCPGGQYGKGGERFLRINAACPMSVMKDGMQRLGAGIERYLADSDL